MSAHNKALHSDTYCYARFVYVALLHYHTKRSPQYVPVSLALWLNQMAKYLSVLSLIISLFTLSILGYLMYKDKALSERKTVALNAYSLSHIEKGDLISISGYMHKSRSIYELYETRESSKFAGSNGYVSLAILHPSDNISSLCIGVWVNIIGVAEYSLWGSSIDTVHSITSLENGQSCLVDEALRIKYLDVIDSSIKNEAP